MSDAARILWQRLDVPGHEFAEVTPVADGWQVAGVAVFVYEGQPCRVEYTLRCDTAWRTRHASIRGRHGCEEISLDVDRTSDSEWRVGDADVPALAGCPDIDFGFSPVTNLLPVRRLDLAIGESSTVRAAWLRFPELTLEVLEQSYTRNGERTYVYESAGGVFRRELTVNEAGLVLEYPDYWHAEAAYGSRVR